jgi:hypothetical protein
MNKANLKHYPKSSTDVTMTEFVTNRLSFRTNAKTILNLIKAGAAQGDSPAQFSLDTIKPMPKALAMPYVACLNPLVAMNIALPAMAENVRQMALTRMFSQPLQKADTATLQNQIVRLGEQLKAIQAREGAQRVPGSDKTCLEWFEQAVANYTQFNYFTQYDWRTAHWGTPEEIQSVEAATFELPTTMIEFSTLWTPPIAALQELADMFPSVRFELTYRLEPSDPWTLVEIFPVKPWGY